MHLQTILKNKKANSTGNWYPLYISSKVYIESETGTEVYQARKKSGIWGFLLFLRASKYFCTQSDPPIPWPWKNPDEAGIDGRINHVFPVCVVIKVSLKYLKKYRRKTTQLE